MTEAEKRSYDRVRVRGLSAQFLVNERIVRFLRIEEEEENRMEGRIGQPPLVVAELLLRHRAQAMAVQPLAELVPEIVAAHVPTHPAAGQTEVDFGVAVGFRLPRKMKCRLHEGTSLHDGT